MNSRKTRQKHNGHLKELLGIGMIVASVIGTYQSLAEWRITSTGFARFRHTVVESQPIVFGGRTIRIKESDQNGSATKMHVVSIWLDSAKIARDEMVEVAPARSDIDRYWGWIQVTAFRDKVRNEDFLVIARRIQVRATSRAKFQIITIFKNGRVDNRTLASGALGNEYITFLGTDIVASDTSRGFPLSVLNALSYIPFLPLIFPVGSLLSGTFFCRRLIRLAIAKMI